MPTLPRKSFVSVLSVAAVAATTGYVLVDLSDTTNYPHLETSELHLLGLFLQAEKASDGDFNLTIGTVIENDATNGTLKGAHLFNISHLANSTDSTDRMAPVYVDFTLGGAIPEGINLQVVSGAVTHFRSNITDADNTIWQNDTGLLSPVGAAAGATGKPGVGDLVVLAEENAGAGTLDFCITAIYSVA